MSHRLQMYGVQYALSCDRFIRTTSIDAQRTERFRRTYMQMAKGHTNGEKSGLGVMTYRRKKYDGSGCGTQLACDAPLPTGEVPLEVAFARLDQDFDEGELLFLEGTVRGGDGTPIPCAVLEVWRIEPKDAYMPSDSSQPNHVSRCRIGTDINGQYALSANLPVGDYRPLLGTSEGSFDCCRRRSTLLHFLIEAEGHQKVTFHFSVASHGHPSGGLVCEPEGLLVRTKRYARPEEMFAHDVTGPFHKAELDVVLVREDDCLLLNRRK